MTQRTPPPTTKLRRRYHRIGERGFSTNDRRRECDSLCEDAGPLVDEFIEALRELEAYDNREEAFNPEEQQRKGPGDVGTGTVIQKLRDRPVSVPALKDYRFEYVARELSPLRTTQARAPRSGTGGLDYVAILDSDSPTPILGEIKVAGDKDAYYAFVQLLTYLSEIASAAQTERANKFLFKNAKIVYPATYDLHILLADFNDRGGKGPITTSTHVLAKSFKKLLDGRSERPHHVGRVMCLRMDAKMFDGMLGLEWCV